MTIEERVEKVEMELARLKRPDTGGREDMVMAKKFILVDENGKVRAMLCMHEGGPKLALFDENGKSRVGLSVIKGVAGAIKRKGGPKIQQECDKIGGTFVGGAVITTGGSLKAKYVIHAVGPRMGEGNEDEKLKNATLNSLKLADGKNLKSIAFPAISAGIFGFPIRRCAEIMLRTTIDYLKGKTGLEKVAFCLYGQDSYEVFADQLMSAKPQIS